MTPLSEITTIVFPMYPVYSGTANMQVVMSHTDPAYPNAGKFQTSGAGVLILSDDGPALLSDLELSQLQQISEGAPALDDISFQFRDTTGYTGTVNGDSQSEDFSLSTPPTTFFTVFFSDTIGFNTKKFPLNVWFLRYAVDGVTLIEISYMGHYDPNYKPQTNQLVSSQMTEDETLNEGAVRTFKTVELGAALKSVLFQSTLNIIGESDCELGAGYMGYAWQPDHTTCAGGYNNHGGIFTTGSTQNNLMQATPYEHGYTWPGVNIYNAVSPSISGRTSLWPNTWLPWDTTHQPWFGPAGTWWISIGTLFSKIAGSFGQLYATDGTVTNGGDTITSLSGQFSSNLVGRTIHFSKPAGGGSGSAVISGVSGTTIVTLTSFTFAADGSNLYWWTEGSSDQQITFDVDGQLGASSAVAENSLAVWKQTIDIANKCYPLDTSAAIVPKDIYISVNDFFGCHPHDGSLWNNPLTFSPGVTLSQVIQGLCNFLQCEYTVVPDQTTGKPALVLLPIAQSIGTFPAGWTGIGDFTEQEPSSSALAVTVSNSGGVTVMCPYSNETNIQNFIMPIKLHAWGSAVEQTDDMTFLGISTQRTGLIGATGTAGGAATATNPEWGLIFDGTTPAIGQAEECFKVVWYDANNNPQINANCWKGLAYAMWKDTSNSNIMYPTGNGFNTPLQNGSGDGGWNGSPSATAAFYALGALYAPGVTATANESNEDRFNTVDYPSVVFATYSISASTLLLQRDFFGTADSDNKLTTINVGTQVTIQYDGKERIFRIIALPRYLLTDTTIAIQFQEILSSDFPDITSELYGVQPTSNNSSVSGSGGGGYAGGGTNNGSIFSTSTQSLSSDTNNWSVALNQWTDISLSASSAINITGLANGNASYRVTITNTGSNAITFINQSASSSAANRFLFSLSQDITLGQEDSFTLFYDSSVGYWRRTG